MDYYEVVMLNHDNRIFDEYCDAVEYLDNCTDPSAFIAHHVPYDKYGRLCEGLECRRLDAIVEGR